MNNEFFPVRILTAWSKTINVTYVTIADCRTSELQNSMKHKVLGQLITKFEEKYAFNDSKLLFLLSLIISRSSFHRNYREIFPYKNHEDHTFSKREENL